MWISCVGIGRQGVVVEEIDMDASTRLWTRGVRWVVEDQYSVMQ
jgi:hypothetical protein